jgi:hypothetical protein
LTEKRSNLNQIDYILAENFIEEGADAGFEFLVRQAARNLSWITKVCATPGQRLAKVKNAEQPTRLPVILTFTNHTNGLHSFLVPS